MPTLQDFNYDGRAALRAVVESLYGTLEQAVASLTLFTNPATVHPTGNHALFKIRRAMRREERGAPAPGGGLYLCDNRSCIFTFNWSNQLPSPFFFGKQLQLNHIYPTNHLDVHVPPESLYTSLANLCVTPAFLAKETDTNQTVRRLLKYRAYQLYNGYDPYEIFGPNAPPPEGYNDLEWADPLPPVHNPAAALTMRIADNPESTIAKSCRAFGWLLG